MSITPSTSFTAQEFRKSSFSLPDRDCVEVAYREGTAMTQLRDSKIAFGTADDGRLTVNAAEFGALLRSMRS